MKNEKVIGPTAIAFFFLLKLYQLSLQGPAQPEYMRQLNS